ncbi:MAG: YlxM family DNA-binding protein [Oscillospiraceae bacterium]|nr:YlxM family DNA-binding protein [Oscillospiraceae bacterium]
MKNLEISVLMDFYGDMLTDKQKDVIELYYDEDLSLGEIAQHEGITRQGVRDSIKRGEGLLMEMEERLGLARRFRQVQGALAEIVQCAKDIDFYNTEYINSKEIAARAERIIQLAKGLDNG